jgi:heparan-alpha-glucosaminide N-acetyltransferase
MSNRIKSIDAFRAITMLLMIFVNDFWTLSGIPKWLEHATATEDFIGFSDLIFPAFLFIVGLSIPLAVAARRNKGFSNRHIATHIIFRALALLVMGFFLVNYLNITPELMPISKAFWTSLMVVAFFLVWMDYQYLGKITPNVQRTLQLVGLLLLFGLALIYRSGSEAAIAYIQIRWWGILGLIGWSYLFNSLIFLFVGHRLLFVAFLFVVFHLLHLQEFIPLGEGRPIRLIISASNYSCVSAGVLAGVLLNKLKLYPKRLLIVFFVLGLVFLLYGWELRPFWGGFSKIRATPSWTLVSIGVSYLTFLIIYVLVDVLNWDAWTRPIKSAGAQTLTCYVLPYLIYQILVFLDLIDLPNPIGVGGIGLLKSFLFSFAIIGLAALLNRYRIRLKI